MSVCLSLAAFNYERKRTKERKAPENQKLNKKVSLVKDNLSTSIEVKNQGRLEIVTPKCEANDQKSGSQGQMLLFVKSSITSSPAIAEKKPIVRRVWNCPATWWRRLFQTCKSVWFFGRSHFAVYDFNLQLQIQHLYRAQWSTVVETEGRAVSVEEDYSPDSTNVYSSRGEEFQGIESV